MEKMAPKENVSFKHSFEDAVAQEVHRLFAKLPRRCKPRLATQTTAECAVLCGIVVVEKNGPLTCVALGTGMKCLPASKVSSAQGNILHDWHAEVLAIRAFNLYLIAGCHALASSPRSLSKVVAWRDRSQNPDSGHLPPFVIREDVEIWMYCSEAPCGDASMELVMDAQEDATPWPVSDAKDGHLRGRESFDQLGVVRGKPGRRDSPETFSKSCSDKVALKQCTSLLSGPTSLLISPENAYLSTLVIPEHQYREKACERAFGKSGRMEPVATQVWPGGYAFVPFQVKTTRVEFDYSLKAMKASREGNLGLGLKCKPSNISAVWTSGLRAVRGQHSAANETLINGVLQGRRPLDPSGTSDLSRKRIWQAVAAVLGLLDPTMAGMKDLKSYRELKDSELLAARRTAKSEATREALSGWQLNVFDNFDLFPLESGQVEPSQEVKHIEHLTAGKKVDSNATRETLSPGK